MEGQRVGGGGTKGGRWRDRGWEVEGQRVGGGGTEGGRWRDRGWEVEGQRVGGGGKGEGWEEALREGRERVEVVRGGGGGGGRIDKM